MITRITTIEELKEIFVETLLNKTNKISKVSDNSVVGGISYGVAKVAQKALKDIALVETHLFPQGAYGQYLDTIAENFGISGRFGQLGSSTYIRLVGDSGTTYTQAANTFSGNMGVTFTMDQITFTMPSIGFAYIKVSSTEVGLRTNVDPLSISTVTNPPAGHRYVINEYQATGGRNVENDTDFKARIKDGANLAATGTLAKLTQVFQIVNPNVLKVLYQGVSASGKLQLKVLSVNGADFQPTDFANMINQGQDYLSITELAQWGTNSVQIELLNAVFQPLDMSFRVELIGSFNADDVRIAIQTNISKYLDYRYWKPRQTIEWDDLLQVVKQTPGVKYVPDTTFIPGADIPVGIDVFPRLRGFMMLDLDGNIIVNQSGTLTPVFYPAIKDASFQNTLLTTII